MSDILVVFGATAVSVAIVGLGIYGVHRISRVRIHPERRESGPVPAPSLSSDDNFREPWVEDREQ